MARPFEELIEERQHDIDGISDWRWIAVDNGAWDGPKDDWVGSHKQKYFEKVKKFDVVVQAGGNCGMYPRLLSYIFKTVYTFEPDPLNFFALCLNCQERNIVKMQAALGEQHLLVDCVQQRQENVGMHQVEISDTGIIPLLKLDDLALRDCDLILLDIEGFEIYALKGAINTIKRFRPVVVLESPKLETRDFILNLNYEQYAVSAMDTIFIPKEQS